MDAAVRSRLDLLLASVPDPRAAKHFLESLRQVSLRIKCRGWTVHLKALLDDVAERKSGHRWFGS